MEKRDRAGEAVFVGARPHFTAHLHSRTATLPEIFNDDEQEHESAPDCLDRWVGDGRLVEAGISRQIRHNNTQLLEVTN